MFILQTGKENILCNLDIKTTRNRDRRIVETTISWKSENNDCIVNRKYKVTHSYKITAVGSYVNRAINVWATENILRRWRDEMKIIEKICT